MRDPHPAVIDVMVVVCLVGGRCATEFGPRQPGFEPGNAFSLALSALLPLPLLWRRSDRRRSWCVTFGGMVVHSVPLFPGAGPFVAC